MTLGCHVGATLVRHLLSLYVLPTLNCSFITQYQLAAVQPVLGHHAARLEKSGGSLRMLGFPQRVSDRECLPRGTRGHSLSQLRKKTAWQGGGLPDGGAPRRKCACPVQRGRGICQGEEGGWHLVSLRGLSVLPQHCQDLTLPSPSVFAGKVVHGSCCEPCC